METPNLTQVSAAIKEMSTLRARLESHGDDFLDALLSINLRNLSGYKLARLKKRLRNFNQQNHHWKD